MKGLLILGVALVAVVAWAMRSPSPPAPAAPVAGPESGAAQPVRLTPEQFAAEVRRNAPLREQLAKQYPNVYRDLAVQAKGDLGKCLVTKVLDGVLKAVCR